MPPQPLAQLLAVVLLLALVPAAAGAASPVAGVTRGSEAAVESGAAAGQITISTGGTYSGTWTSTTSTPAVRVATTEPVAITNSTVTGPGDLIVAEPGARVRIAQVTAIGGTGRFFIGPGVKSLTIRNCSITRTAGIYLFSAQPGAAISITRNRQWNVQTQGGPRSFAQFDKVTTAAIDVSWNEVVSAFGQSLVEDNISIHWSAYAKIHDNYIRGAYPASPDSGYSGSGIMIEGADSHDNDVYANQIVETTNAGIGIAGGYSNKVYGNKLFFDGKLDDGTKLAGANVGVYVWNSAGHATWANNQAYGNTVGWINASGKRNDWWLPHCTGNCTNARYRGVLNADRERAVYRAWRAKLAANGITIGRKPKPSRR